MIWTLAYRAGPVGFLVAFTIAGGVSIGQVFEFDKWPVREGDGISILVVQTGLGALMICGFLLLIPCLPHVFRYSDYDRTNRLLWAAFLILFPYLGPYIYYRNHFRKHSE